MTGTVSIRLSDYTEWLPKVMVAVGAPLLAVGFAGTMWWFNGIATQPEQLVKTVRPYGVETVAQAIVFSLFGGMVLAGGGATIVWG